MQNASVTLSLISVTQLSTAVQIQVKWVCDSSAWAVLVWAVSVTERFGLGRSGLETFRSGYEILQKS